MYTNLLECLFYLAISIYLKLSSFNDTLILALLVSSYYIIKIIII